MPGPTHQGDVRQPMMPSRPSALPMYGQAANPQATALPTMPWQQGMSSQMVNRINPLLQQRLMQGRGMSRMMQPQTAAPPQQQQQSIAAWRQRLMGVAGKRAAMKEGGLVEKTPKAKKLAKPIKRKSFKKADRVKKPAFKEGGAVERFLQKYPDYNPEK